RLIQALLGFFASPEQAQRVAVATDHFSHPGPVLDLSNGFERLRLRVQRCSQTALLLKYIAQPIRSVGLTALVIDPPPDFQVDQRVANPRFVADLPQQSESSL